jgi:hypothetical protein
MAEQKIICPKCGNRIPISEALRSEIEKDVRASFDKKYKERLYSDTVRIRKEEELKATAKLGSMQKHVDESRRREEKLQVSFDERVSKLTLRAEKDAEKKAKKLAQEENFEQISDLRKQLREQENTKDKFEEEYEEKERGLKKQLRDARRQVDGLEEKLKEQGSEKVKGEETERKLEDMLIEAFRDDKIVPVASGSRGADILQKIYSPRGVYCGTIIWESKNTRTWSKGWLSKLRNDQRRAKAELAVLVSVTALPKEVSALGQLDGVWVTKHSLAIGLATALRINLIQVALLKQPNEGMDEKKELLYKYLSGIEFKHRVEAVVEAFRSMQDELEKERRATESHWSKREKQLQLVIQNISGMYGDMQGIAGQSLPRIRVLELPEPQAT